MATRRQTARQMRRWLASREGESLRLHIAGDESHVEFARSVLGPMVRQAWEGQCREEALTARHSARRAEWEAALAEMDALVTALTARMRECGIPGEVM